MDVFVQGPRVLTLAISFWSIGVPSLTVPFEGLWVLSLAVFFLWLRHHFSHIVILSSSMECRPGDLDGPLWRSPCVPDLPALPPSPTTPRTRGRSSSKLLAGAP